LLLTFRPLSETQRPSSEEAGTRSSSSGSWRDKLVPSQERFRDSSQDHEKIQCTLCYETMGYGTLKNVLVHPKDREDKEQTTECVYKVPCASCEKTYIGETGRKLGIRLQEHRSKVESKTNRAFTRRHRSSSSAESNRSALTDHAVRENHVISWSAASVTESLIDLPDGSRRQFISGRKVHDP